MARPPPPKRWAECSSTSQCSLQSAPGASRHPRHITNRSSRAKLTAHAIGGSSTKSAPVCIATAAGLSPPAPRLAFSPLRNLATTFARSDEGANTCSASSGGSACDSDCDEDCDSTYFSTGKKISCDEGCDQECNDCPKIFGCDEDCDGSSPLPSAYPVDLNAWYCPGAFNIASSTWQDCSGNGKTATLSGSGLAELRSEGHGATSEVLALSGTTSSVISFGAVIQSEFTVCSVTRYTGGAKGRILNGVGANWLHGHWSGRAASLHLPAGPPPWRPRCSA